MSVSAENLAAAVMSAATGASSADNKENNTASRTVTASNLASATSAKFGLVDPFSASAAKVKMYDAEKKQIILMRGGQEALTGVFIVRKMRVAMRVDGVESIWT